MKGASRDESVAGAALLGERVSVLIPRPFAGGLTYLAPPGLVAGTYVRVPLGRSTVAGVVWGPAPDAPVKAKAVLELIDGPPMPPGLMSFIDWVAAYTLAPRGEVLALAVKEALLRPPPARSRPPAFGNENYGLTPPELSPAQADAVRQLQAAVAAETFSVTLLDGVTGSGKTEVYLEAVAAALAAGRQALVLLPEIALSVQVLGRFAARFGSQPAVWHSELTPARRLHTFRAVARGQVQVVVGARSALFLPFTDLGLIVVDEEHESAFKQQDGVMYHARDMAVVRARIAHAACVLASATPSLETVENAAAGRYAHVRLPARHGGAALPAIGLIDMRGQVLARGRFLSPALGDALTATLARGEQAMLFLNRRGYAPLTLCRHCGHRLACPHCTAWLVEHRRAGRLVCHHCDYTAALPARCPACEAEQSFVPIGPGVERIEEEVAAAFPAARRLVMASDVIAGPAAAAAAASAIAAREVDIIIGTQMVAKGWHFPHLTLVGVVDADLGLAGGDLRAAERTVQMLHQVAGRAGRAAAPGQVWLQTYAPEHPVMTALAAGDLAGFLAQEAAQRRPGHWPPFGRLVALIVSGTDEPLVDTVSRRLAGRAPRVRGIEVLGPAPAPFAILRGRHRRRLLMKAARGVAVQRFIKDWLADADIPRSVRVDVDVDPVSFM
jgi:primosomal protein N' (replication factor Y)